MRRFILTLGLAALTGIAATALGATVRFANRPASNDNGTTVTVSGSLTGLGPQEFTVRVRATGTGRVQCVNPAGGEPSGQRRTTPIAVTGETLVAGGDVLDGSAAFSVTTAEPHVTGLACPNDQWTAQLEDVQFRTVTVRVFQGGRVVLRRTWTM